MDYHIEEYTNGLAQFQFISMAQKINKNVIILFY